jgi:RND family efflux transporter MFP subunit
MNQPFPDAAARVEPAAPAELTQWLARQCAAIPASISAVFVSGAPDTGPFAPLAFWPSAEIGAPRLVEVAEQALAERVPVRLALGAPAWALALPVQFDGHLHGVYALEVGGGDAASVEHALAQMQAGLVWVEAWHRRAERGLGADTEARLMAVLDLMGVVLEEDRFEPACRALVTELAARLQCDRVSLGVVRPRLALARALPHSAQIGKQMDLIQAVGAAMDEAIDQRVLIRYPAGPGDDIVVTRDHERLASSHGSGSVLTVPMAGSSAGRQRFAAALVFERPARMPFVQAEIDLAQSVAAVAVRILELKQRDERALPLRAADAAREQLRRLFGPRFVRRKLAAAALLLGAVFFSVATGDYRVTAPATLEGAVRRTLAAPFEGFIATAPRRAGDVVRAGEVLATLDEREMRLERMKWASQYEQYMKQHQEAVANHDRAKSQVVQALYQQAEAQVAMLDSQLQRVVIRAPFDGVVVKGDLSRALGSAVKRGDTLFEITPLATYRVIVEVDERDIAEVVSNQRGTLILSSITQDAFRFVVGNVTSVTTAREGRNYFRVEATLDHATERLRPGMEGVAKIEIGPRKLIWIWTHRLVNWMRLFIWTWQP